MATSPHSNPKVVGSSLARSQCPYGSGFTPRVRLAGWRSARWDHLGGWEDRGISPPPQINESSITHACMYWIFCAFESSLSPKCNCVG
ncbi:hypothetical protein HanXRQr2_Chr05g0194161 [Helianthus annuus]|uniref:Uncharacterized protein n=1 Tax=Helianthus annuus TaxID=4232 RepID=A0A9K3IWN6_HELAN|nr:hypothetical protein HanXRQr2_Chr05g0194161 [Helianthus annuus]